MPTRTVGLAAGRTWFARPDGPIAAASRVALIAGGLVVLVTAGLLASLAPRDSLVLAGIVVASTSAITCLFRPELGLATILMLAPIGIGAFASNDTGTSLDVAALRLPLLLCSSMFIFVYRGSGVSWRDLDRPLRVAIATYVLLILWLLVGLSSSIAYDGGFRYIFKLLVPLSLGLAIVSMGRAGPVFARRIAAVLLFGTLTASYSMLATGYGSYRQGDLERFGGIAGSGPSLGMLSALLSILCLVFWIESGRRLYLLLWVATCPILLLSLTRSAVGAWLMGSFVAFLLGRRWKIGLILITIALGAVISSTALANRFVIGTQRGWGDVAASVGGSGIGAINTSGRSEIWAILVDAHVDRRFVGAGAGTAEALVSEVTRGVLNEPHSEYLSLLVDAGWIGAGLWIVTWFAVGIAIAKTSLIAPTAGVVVCFLVIAAVDSPIANYAHGGVPMGLAVGWALARRIDRMRTPPAVLPPTRCEPHRTCV